MHKMEIRFTKKQINGFKEIGVQTVYLFGSYAKRKYIHDLSDIDIGIVLEKPEVLENDSLDLYSKVYDIIVDSLPKTYLKKRFAQKKHEVDIVFLQQGPIKFQFEAIKDAKILYEGNKELRLQYEENIMKMRCDLDYFYKLSYKHLLERI